MEGEDVGLEEGLSLGETVGNFVGEIVIPVGTCVEFVGAIRRNRRDKGRLERRIIAWRKSGVAAGRLGYVSRNSRAIRWRIRR